MHTATGGDRGPPEWRYLTDSQAVRLGKETRDLLCSKTVDPGTKPLIQNYIENNFACFFFVLLFSLFHLFFSLHLFSSWIFQGLGNFSLWVIFLLLYHLLFNFFLLFSVDITSYFILLSSVFSFLFLTCFFSFFSYQESNS